MSQTDTTEISEAEGRILAARIREKLAHKRMSRQHLADEARISLSTLEKVLNGSRPFTLATIVRLEEALGENLRPRAEAEETASAQAPAHLGAYSPGSVKWLEGDYLTLRPSFGMAGAIYAYRTTIAWDARAGCLVFSESGRVDSDYAQKGVVSVPTKSGHIYLQTSEDGQFRLAILGRPVITGEMYGVLTTLQAGSGTQLQPVSVALAMVPLKDGKVELGRIAPGAPSYDMCRQHLERVTKDGFGKLLTL
ncbi:MAG TPA: helix-turn-helix transcriptional regulator [Rhizomicrobium sp.]|nr:helix-turn-helix transcriptional regulator [Rhizomicrobium sp.]